MAVIDTQATFTFNKRVNADGATDVVDLKSARTLSVGHEKIYVVVRVVDALNNDSDSVYKVQLRSAPTVVTGVLNSTGRVIHQTIDLPRGSAAGTVVYAFVRPEELNRYVDAYIDVTGTSADGDVVIELTPTEPRNYRYMDFRTT